MELAKTDAVVVCLVVVVESLVEWAKAGVVCFIVVLKNLWVMVGPLVDWTGAVMDCLAEVVGKLWVMVEALVERAAKKAVLGCLVVGSSLSLYCLFVFFPWVVLWRLQPVSS